MTSAYPAHREADVVLHDGSTVHLRPLRRGDEEALLRFFEGLSVESRAFRFFSGAADLERAARSLAAVDYAGNFGLLATRGRDGHVVGHGVYVGTGEDRAEVAFAVAEELQGRGLGTILLAHLAEVAEENGIRTFVADVLPANHRMIEMFRQSGFPVDSRAGANGILVELPTSLSPQAVARFEERDRLAATEAVRSFLEPRSIAVVGASRDPGKVGGALLRNLLDSGFPGAILPVNARAAEVQSVPAFARIADVPGEVDLAVIAVPAPDAVAAARECGEAGVRALVVLSAGFRESGPEGAARERELLGICRESGMRLVGPNCLGVLNTAPDNGFNATFAPQPPPPGDVGFVTQSGALGLALIELASSSGLGVSSFASVGNRADITANDLLEYWEQDPGTAVALLYIESFSDPRRFSRVARRVGRRKPIVVVKSGRSAAGARAAGSHTGALLAASDRASDALFHQAGVIRAETIAELLDVTELLSDQPLPQGPRVGILTNAGGPGIMCADACEAAGLEIPEVPPRVRERLRSFLPAEAGVGNPVDMIATAGAEEYRRAIETLAAWEGIDALIVIFIRPLLTKAEDVAAAVRSAVAELPRRLPVQAVFMSADDQAHLRRAAAVATYAFPEEAARALAKAVRHSSWRQSPAAAAPELPGIRRDEADAVVAEALRHGREWLDADECTRLLDCYGIPTPASETAATAAAAGAAAASLGGKVALKAHGRGIIHKSELGAVALGLEGAREVEAVARRMEATLAAQSLVVEAFLVQRMVGGGTELLVGVASDPVFGPVIACGAGGTAVELLGDVAIRVCPLAANDAAEMIRELAIFPLLTGYRGSPPADLGAVEDVIVRVGALADHQPAIVELDLNPVLAGPAGACAADVRIRVAPPPPPRSWPRTWA